MTTTSQRRQANRRDIRAKELGTRADRLAEQYERQNDVLYREYLIAIGREPEAKILSQDREK